MAEPVQLRVAAPPGTIVVIRLGTQTLGDGKLAQQCERTHARWGFHGFSVFEVPDDDYRLLARLVPIVTVRPKLFEARGGDLIEAGFPLIPTADHPHWDRRAVRSDVGALRPGPYAVRRAEEQSGLVRRRVKVRSRRCNPVPTI